MTETQSAQEKIEEEFLDTCNDFRWQRSEHNIMNTKGNINFNYRDDFEELLNYLKSQGFHIGKWLPITDEQKDEKSILLYAKHKLDLNYSIIQASWFEAQFYADSKECVIDWDDGLEAKYFMPLPPVPEGRG